MATFDVAHIREQGVDLVIVFVSSSFGHESSTQQNRTIDGLQVCARSAGLAGTVVPVWDSGGGCISFIAPRSYHPFFSSISLQDVAASVNRRLTCG